MQAVGCRNRPSRAGVRYTITECGTPRMQEYRNRQEYRALLRETPHHDAALGVEQDGGDWMIVAGLEPALTHGQSRMEKTGLGGGQVFDTETQARRHLDAHEDELRMELVEDLFTMGLCAGCGSVVPVVGDYVAYSPAGMLACGPCQSREACEADAPRPAILHP